MGARTLRAALSVVMLLGLGASAAVAQESPTPTPSSPVVSEQDKYQAYVQPSIVYLHLEWTGWVYDKYNKGYLNDGDPFILESSCTGFVVNEDGTIATAGHCIDPASVSDWFLDEAAAWALETDYYVGGRNFAQVRGWAEDDYRVEGENKGAANAYTKGADLVPQAVWSTSSTEPLYDKYGDLNGTPHDARVIDFMPWNNGAGDVGLIKVEGVQLPALPVATEAVETGVDVVAIGYPAVVGEVSDATLSDPSFKEGSVSSVRTDRAYPIYELSASMSGGMSGGPTVDASGQVIGVNSYGLASGESVFEFAQSSQTLVELMTDAGVENDLGQLGTAYRAGLDAYFAGDKEAAIESFTSVVAIDPEFSEASQYLALSQQLPDPPKRVPATSDRGLSVVPILLGVLALGGLVVGGVFLMRRRRSPERAAREQASESVKETAELELKREASNGPDAPRTGWYCSNCGNHMQGSAKFCSECGADRAGSARVKGLH